MRTVTQSWQDPPPPSFVVPFFVCPPVFLEYVVLRWDSPTRQTVLGVIVSWVLSFSYHYIQYALSTLSVFFFF